MPPEIQRKLTTILAADAAGYSRLMEADEVGTYDNLHAARGVFTRLIERHHGRIANTAGDGLIAEFPSVVEAVQCAIEVQTELAGLPKQGGKPLLFRIGIHLGDVMVDGDDLLGEGVNLAARLQSMAQPGGVLISQQVYDQVHAKLSVGFDYLGERRPKNYSEDVPVYRVSHGKDQRLFEFGPKEAPKARPDRISRKEADIPRPWPLRSLTLAGITFAALLLIDLVTGPPLWAHWPGLAFVTLIGLALAPRLAEGRTSPTVARTVVLVLALVLINLFTWSGYFWAMWPAGALIFACLAWRVISVRF